MGKRFVVELLILSVFMFTSVQGAFGQSDAYIAQPGDTWTALAIHFNVDESELRALNPHFNSYRQPPIGRPVQLPASATERQGTLIRSDYGGLVQLAAEIGQPPWAIALRNRLASPYQPTLYQPLYLSGEGVIRDLPIGIGQLDLSAVPAAPGIALGLRGTTKDGVQEIIATLDGLPVSIIQEGQQFAGVVGTGAFYESGEPELLIKVGESPPWIQPWAFAERDWIYQELTLTGEAAQIDQQARDEERARLRDLWAQITPTIAWDAPFVNPVESFLDISAGYGARRSYNGGPYLTYHEGVDFSAYGGTPVLAPAAGTVVLAERLYVRGGAVIIDHGLGVYTGYYHLSAIHAVPGQLVRPGDLLGEVGTTGLSTGNHLHWDMLINGIWVDASAWQASGLDCWLLEGLGHPCVAAPETSEP